MRWLKKGLELALTVLVLLVASEYIQLQSEAYAAVDLVTVPAREGVQLTIYNSEDITLVKDRRKLTFKKGDNQIQFSWANTLIDPTSVELRVLEHGESLEIMDISYPANRPDCLVWNIKSDMDRAAQVEITYFTSGITWKADYVALTGEREKEIELIGKVGVANNSGEDYENAQVRLIVGTIHLVEKIADLARKHWRELPRKVKDGIKWKFENALKKAEKATYTVKLPAETTKPKRIVKEGLSEYFLYTIEGTETVPHRWIKRLPSLRVSKIPIKVIYRYSDVKYNNLVTKFYKFKNRKVLGKKRGEPNLGEEPLPDGMVRVFKRDKAGRLSFIGQRAIKYMPIGEDVEINLGHDPDVLLERKVTDFKKLNIKIEDRGGGPRVVGYDTQTRYQTRVKNTKKIAIQFEVERRLSGDWEIESERHFDKLDQQTIRFVIQLRPNEEKMFRYVVTQRHGKNARR